MVESPTIKVSSPILDFIFPKKIGRASYVLRLLAILIGYFFVAHGLQGFPADSKFRLLLTLALVIFTVIYVVGFVLLPRVRSFGLPWWAVLMLFVPLVGQIFALLLLVCPEGSWQRIREGAAP